MFIVVAEKGSVAGAIRRVLRKRGVRALVLATNGHVMDSELPDGYEWGKVDPREIFQLTDSLRFVVRNRRAYGELVNAFKNSDGTLVIATDNDPEGELIGYEVLMIYRRVRRGGRYFRMRFNSVDEGELWRAWNSLEPDLNWRWVYRALFRQNFDLITGAAFTRFLTGLARRHSDVKLVSWGSCQTPTLYFVVQREREIEGFKPKTYWYVEAEVRAGLYTFRVRSKSFEDERDAARAFEAVRRYGRGVVSLYAEEERVVRRPLPLTTDYMLKDLVRITGLSAAKVLDIAEWLYSEGYISYPRTETDIFREGFDFETPLRAVLASSIGAEVSKHLSSVPNPYNGRKDDGAHPPIYPLKPYPMDGSERWRVWEYVARRFVANVYSGDAVLVSQRLYVTVGGVVLEASGSYFRNEGFYRVFPYFKPSPSPLPRLARGEIVAIASVKLRRGRTSPPSRLSEADLLGMLERHGIGTDATRATFPKLIVDRGYAAKRRGRFVPTELGRKLIEALEAVNKRLVTPDTRRYVEELMDRITRGEVSMEEALRDAVARYLELFDECRRMSHVISEMLREGLRSRDRPGGGGRGA